MTINKLPAANYVPAKLPMRLIYPRVDTETGTYARHKFAHTGMDYRIPVGVMGGAWPFYYEVISGPSGLTVGGNYGDTDYGVVNWPAASVAGAGAGPHSVTLRVTDQEETTVDVVWDIAVDDTQFVFIDSATGTSGVGTIGDPLKLFTDWFEGDVESTTYQNKIAVFRAGAYTVTGEGSGGNGDNINLNCDQKTRSLIGYPGETSILDCALAKFMVGNNGFYPDFYVGGLTFQNARKDVDDAHFFWLTNARTENSRVVFHENTFDTINFGKVGDDNSNSIFFSGGVESQGARENVLIKGNNFLNMTTTAVEDRGDDWTGNHNGAGFTSYKCDYHLIEENTTSGGDREGLALYVKGNVKFNTVRANNTHKQISVNHGAEASYRPEDKAGGLGLVPHDFEVCWNKVIFPPGSVTGNVTSMRWSGSLYWEGQHYNNYFYRNTFKGGRVLFRFEGTEPYEVEDNIIEHSANNFAGFVQADYTYATGRETLFVDDIEDGAFNTAYTDASGNLFDDAGNGNARTTYFGTKGAEVSYTTSVINQLPVGNYITARQTAHLIHPRPDSETASWAKHRKHYPGIKYEVPVGVSFGSWPFFYDLTTAPEGATIGENVTEVNGELVPGDDYGVVTWDNPTVGTHNFQVTVSFQDGASPLVIEWTLEVTTTGTIFVDAVNGLDTNDGTINNPLQTMEGWYKADLNDRTYTGYQVCYLAGTYDVTTTDTNTSGNLQLAYNNKPLVHYAKDTESVIWDFQYNNFASGEGSQPSGNGEYHFHDWFLGRITCTGGPTGDNKRRWMIFSSVESAWPYDGTQGACRNTWFKSPQIDWTATGAVNDNSGIVFGAATGSEAPARIYFYVTQCPITNIRTTQPPTNFNGWWLGQTAYFLAEHNVITNTNFGRSPFSAKSSEYRSCYRNIDMSAAPDQPFIPDCAGSYADGYGGGSELSYSKINYTEDGNGLTAVQWGHHFLTFDDVTYPKHEKNYQFRNSISKAPGPNGECFRSPSSWPTEVIQDIWCSEGDGIYLSDAPENTQANGDWKLYAIPNNPFDSSMNLTDTEFEGTHGATLSNTTGQSPQTTNFVIPTATFQVQNLYRQLTSPLYDGNYPTGARP